MIDCALLKNSSLLRVKVRGMPGNVRKVPVSREAAEKLLGDSIADLVGEQREERITAALAKLKASTTLIACPELSAVSGYQSEFKNWLLSQYCNPSFIDEGLFSVRTEIIPSVREQFGLAARKLEYELLPALSAVYLDQVAKAVVIWGEKACKGLPTVEKLPGCFGIDYRLTQLDVPEGLPPEIRAEEEAKLRESFAQAEQAITGALWAEFQKMVDRVSDRLTVGGDGKKTVFRDTLFEDLTTFIGSFNNRNTFNDGRLKDLVEKAQGIIAKVGGETNADNAGRMRNFEGLRNQTARAFSALTQDVVAAIAEAPSRSFSFDDV